MEIKMDRAALQTFLPRAFPQVAADFVVESLSEDQFQMRLKVAERHLRPGGTVSGPSIFALADVTAYLLTLSRIGPRALAVTTNCSIDFMRKPEAGRDLVSEGRLLKLGRTLSVSDVLIFSEGSGKAVARASLTYSLPPAGSEADKTF